MQLDTPRFGALRAGDHLCFPYESDDEKESAVVAFVREGLSGGERCLYIGTPADQSALLAALRAAGTSPDRALARGALVLATQEETYLRTGAFVAEDALDMLDEHVDAALAEGFVGLRGTGEASGPIPDALWPELSRYESLINERFARRPFIGLCRFQSADVPSERMSELLRRHPVAVVRGEPCENPFYERPELAFCDDSRARLDWQLHQLRRRQREVHRLEALAESMVASCAGKAAERARERAAEATLREEVASRDRFLASLAEELADPLFGLKRELHALGHSAAGLDETPVPERIEAATKHLRRLSAAVERAREIARHLASKRDGGQSS